MSLDEITATPAIAANGWSIAGSSAQAAVLNAKTAKVGARTYALNGGPNATVAFSDDGLTWQANNTLPYRVGSAACGHNGAVFVSGGAFDQETNELFKSVDGVNWTSIPVPWPARVSHCLVSYKGNLLLFGGRTVNGSRFFEDLWMSPDGVSWRSVGAGPRGAINAAAIVLANSLCVVGGPGTMIQWYDGANWTSEPLPWANPRANPTAAVVNNRLYVVGGQSGPTVYKDLWSCAGRSSWRPEADAPWSVLYGPSATEMDGAMLVFGGSPNGAWPASPTIYAFQP